MPLVDDEAVHVLAAQDSRVVTAARSLQLQEGPQLGGGPPVPVDRAGGARASRRSQQAGDVVPGQVPQPALRDAGQVGRLEQFDAVAQSAGRGPQCAR